MARKASTRSSKKSPARRAAKAGAKKSSKKAGTSTARKSTKKTASKKPTSKKASKRSSSSQPWNRPNPKPKSQRTHLTAAQKKKATAQARKQGRSRPSLVDNMNAAKSAPGKKKSSRRASRDESETTPSPGLHPAAANVLRGVGAAPTEAEPGSIHMFDAEPAANPTSPFNPAALAPQRLSSQSPNTRSRYARKAPGE